MIPPPIPDTEKILTKNYTVKVSDTGLNGNIRPAIFVNIFQDFAAHHAEILGLGLPQLDKMDMTWVTAGMDIRIDRYPEWDEKITIKTWPSGQNGLIWYREFQILDANENIEISASSAWLIINRTTKRPVHPKKLKLHMPLTYKRQIDTDFPDPPDLTDCHYEYACKPRFSEMDMNKHVNSTVYLNWVIESMPHDFLRNNMLAELQIAFKAETFLDHNITAKTQIISKDGSTTQALHTISDQQSNQLLAKLKTIWKIV